MKAVIVAAGIGSRLWHKTNKMPKTLMPYKNGTILSTILNNIAATGIHEFVIVVGYRSHEIINYIEKNHFGGFRISFVENPEWEKGNGISVLAAEREVGNENFLLAMSDHIVSVDAIERIANHASETNLLLVDPKVNAIFDIDDATKVQVAGDRIVNIGKEIAEYNGIDCGIFKLTDRFFAAMRQQLDQQQESITAAVRGLIQNDDMAAVFLTEDDFWIDIDTPEAYDYARRILVENRQGEER